MSIFNIGDRVICVNAYDENQSIVGEIGTVKATSTDIASVDFDSKIEHGHICHGECRDGHGWFVANRCLEPYAETAIDAFDMSFEEVFGL